MWTAANALARLAESEELDDPLVEPLKRIAVGRAYYAVYHRARLYALALDYEDPGPGEGSSHGSLWKWFVQKGGSSALIGNLGFSCHRRRKIADYELGEPCPSVDDQLEEANMLAETLKPLENAL